MSGDSIGGPDPSDFAGFIGFAPARDPRIAVYVGIENPKNKNGGAVGGRHAAPVFRQVIDEVLTSMKVPPDKRP